MSQQQLFFNATNALPNELNQVLYCLENEVRSPLPLIMTSMLSSLSSAVQGHVDVRTIYGSVQPVSLFSLVIAESGERKSSTDRLVSKPLLAIEEERDKHQAEINSEISVERVVWRAELRKTERQLLRAMESAPEEVEEVKAALTGLLRREPQAINTMPTRLNDITAAALLKSLAGTGRAVTVASSDSGNVFTRTNMDLISNLNQIWDGEGVVIVRKSGNVIVNGARLTLSLMVQPALLKRISERKEDMLRISGYFARMLVTHPQSTQGYRHKDAVYNDTEYLERYHARLEELAKESAQYQERQQRVILRFNPEAQHVMQRFYDDVESELREWASLAGIKDAGSKIVDNATRLAALIHVYCHGVSVEEIDAENADAACKLAYFYLMEFATLFAEETVQQRAEKNADLLYKWMHDNGYVYPNRTIYLSFMMKYGPNRVRKRDELMLAIAVLVQRNLLIYYDHPKPAGVFFPPAYQYTPPPYEQISAV